MQENTQITGYDSFSKEKLIRALLNAKSKIVSLESDVAGLQYLLFSRKSEKRAVDPEGMQPLFKEVEESSVEMSDDITNKSKYTENTNKDETSKAEPKNKSGRIRLPDSLPRERCEHDLAKEEKQCPFHKTDLIRIGEKVREELEIVPAKVKVIEHVTFSYKCPYCSKDDESTNITSSSRGLPFPIPKSFASPSLLAYIATAKYCDHLPLYRQEQIFARYGIDLKRNTIASWMIQSAKKATPLINLMKDQLIE